MIEGERKRRRGGDTVLFLLVWKGVEESERVGMRRRKEKEKRRHYTVPVIEGNKGE